MPADAVLASAHYVRAKQTSLSELSSTISDPTETYPSGNGASRALKPQPVNKIPSTQLGSLPEQPQSQHIPSTGTPTPAIGAPHNVPAEPTPTFEIHEIHDNPYQPPNLLSSHDASRGLNPQQAKDSQPKKKPSLLRRLIKKLKKWPRTFF